MGTNHHIDQPSEATKAERFSAAYASCHDAFIRYCTALGYGKMDTEDLVQDVLLSAYTHYDRIEQKDKLLHYLIRSARNRAISLLRRAKYRSELIDHHADRLLAHGVSPEQLVDVDLIYRALDKLPAKQREALILFEVSGFSMREIAEIQQSTPGAVKTKISRGRRKVLSLLEDRRPTSSPLWATAKLLLL